MTTTVTDAEATAAADAEAAARFTKEEISERLPSLSQADVDKFRVLAYAAHKNAVDKQWWGTGPFGLIDFGSRNLDEIYLLAVSEIVESFEVYRDRHPLNEIWWDDEHDKKPEGFPIELADFMIRVMDNLVASGFIEPFYRYVSHQEVRSGDTGVGVPDLVSITCFALVRLVCKIAEAFKEGDLYDALKYGATALRACFGLAVKFDFDLWKAIEMKMEFNKTRPVRHGNKLA